MQWRSWQWGGVGVATARDDKSPTGSKRQQLEHFNLKKKMISCAPQFLNN